LHINPKGKTPQTVEHKATALTPGLRTGYDGRTAKNLLIEIKGSSAFLFKGGSL